MDLFFALKTDREANKKKKFTIFFRTWSSGTHTTFFLLLIFFSKQYIFRGTRFSLTQCMRVSVCVSMCLCICVYTLKFVCAGSKTVVTTVCERVCSGSFACLLSPGSNRALVCARDFFFVSFFHSFSRRVLSIFYSRLLSI